MSSLRRKKKKRRLRTGVVIAGIVTAGAALAATVLILGFKTKEVRFYGSQRYTTAELNEYILDNKLPKNSLYYKFFGDKKRELPFVSGYEVSLVSPEIIGIKINEKNLIAFIEKEGLYYYIDDSGEIAEVSDMALRELPEITGLGDISLAKGEALPLEQDALDTIVNYAGTFTRCKLDATGIDFDEDYLASITVKNVKIYCGENSHVTEKLERIKSITPELSDIEGVLHMERFDGSENIMYIQT